MKKRLAGKKISVLFLIGLISATVVVAIGSSNKGARLLQIEREMRKIEEENRELSEKLITKTSLRTLSASVSDLSLTKPTKVLYLSELHSALSSSR